MRKLFLTLALLAGLLAPVAVMAQTPPASSGCTYSISLPITGSKTCYHTFTEYVLDLITKAIDIAGLLALLMILWGAFKYITSGGDDAKARDGKDTITGAVIGLGLLLLIRIILPLIQVQ